MLPLSWAPPVSLATDQNLLRSDSSGFGLDRILMHPFLVSGPMFLSVDCVDQTIVEALSERLKLDCSCPKVMLMTV